MKKINLIYSLLTITFIINSVILFSCKDNTVNPVNNPNTISGKIVNWYYGTNKYAVAYAETPSMPIKSAVLDSSLIDGNGNFSIKIIPPPDSIFSNITLIDSVYCTGNFIINPSATTFSYIFFQVHDGGTSLGSFRLSSDSLNTHSGQCTVWNVYVNQSGTIYGKDSCYYPGDFTQILSCNVSFTNAYNNWYVTYNEYISNKVNESISSQEQSVKWYFFSNYKK